MRELHRRGTKVLAVKSSHHQLSDREGTDSHRLAQAGASGVALLTPNASSLFLARPLQLEQLLPLLKGEYELALVEGGKSCSYPKVELLGKLPPLLADHQVVGRLVRSADKDCPQLLADFLAMVESKGQMV